MDKLHKLLLLLLLIAITFIVLLCTVLRDKREIVIYKTVTNTVITFTTNHISLTNIRVITITNFKVSSITITDTQTKVTVRSVTNVD